MVVNVADHPGLTPNGLTAGRADGPGGIEWMRQMVGPPAALVVARRGAFALLSGEDTGPVTVLLAPAGSGKTVLLRSWIDHAGLRDRVAWVSVERDEQDPQRFWLSVIGELRAAIGANAVVNSLEPTPTFDGEAVVERLISELGSLDQPLILVIDDLDELRSPNALRQLEILLSRRPAFLRIVVASRRDSRLALHRLRLAGELKEIRAEDLRFALEETRELLTASGVALSDAALARVHERTEGWAAGLRLAALALARHPDPDGFVAEFSGSERTVADYLFAEVLERQPEEVRKLLLRTSVLERVTGPLADVLTGGSGSERILQDLEEQNAFVVSLDAGRSRFRYHSLFADLLRLELRRSEPERVGALHRTAARWYAEQDEVIEAVRHAQAAEDWSLAARLFADHVFSLVLAGRHPALRVLLMGFPPNVVAGEPELACVVASGKMWEGSLDEAEAYLALAERNASDIAVGRRAGFEVTLALGKLRIARRRGDVDAALAAAQPLLSVATPTAGEAGPSDGVRADGLMNVGIAELWSGRFEEAERHLGQGLELARIGGWPFIEIQSLAHLAVAAGQRSLAQARARALEAIAIAEAHGWKQDRVVWAALASVPSVDVWQGRFEEAEQWLDRADAAVRAEMESEIALMLKLARGRLHVAQGRQEEAAAAFTAGARLEVLRGAQPLMTAPAWRLLAETQLRLGDMDGVRATLAELDERDPGSDATCTAFAHAHIVEGNPRAAIEALGPVLDGSVSSLPLLLIEALLLDAHARDVLGETEAAEANVERALELAEPNGLLWPFVVTPARELLENHRRRRTSHGALLKEVLDLLAGSSPAARGHDSSRREGLSDSELRVLRYLPSNLSATEIGGELYLSVHTVKTHLKHIYGKLGVHRRTEAVERARELGLLAPSSRLR